MEEDPELGGILSSFHGRLDVMKFKIALSGKGIDDLVISGETMQQAVTAVRYFFISLYSMMRNEYAQTKYVSQVQKLEKILKQHTGDMTRSQLLRNSHWKADEFNTVLKTACEAGLMAEYTESMASDQKSKRVKLLS